MRRRYLLFWLGLTLWALVVFELGALAVVLGAAYGRAAHDVPVVPSPVPSVTSWTL